MVSPSKPIVLDNCISVKDAVKYIGQLWLIEMKSFEEYLVQAGNSGDYRFGLKQSLKRGQNE